ncbi:XRE family transcriptional regulator [Pararobbsia silviterrae]|uniref:XRE family transcriptional regulator n=1 Tax=Pararobbsia silviterrae TaxID=1792498 RepID=UPI0013148DDB|nr:LexA family transcriptional regulator [Pararobbsia silviterrae]
MSLAEIGAQIRRYRLERGLTLMEVQALTGISNSSLSKIETGKQGVPQPKLEALATALQVRVADFFLPTSTNSLQSKSVAVHNSALDATDTTTSPASDKEEITDLKWDDNVAIGTLEVRPDAARGGVTVSVSAREKILFQGSLIRETGVDPENLVSFKLRDSAMGPRLCQNDSIVADRADTEIPDDGGVFLVVIDDKACVRRLHHYINKGIRITTDSGKVPEMTLDYRQSQALVIVGRVKGFQGIGGF